VAENQDLITPELINRIASGQTTLDDLQILQPQFDVTASKGIGNLLFLIEGFLSLKL